jgi:NTP pyrophosphatase (non-canonical NTP hydrolase)
VNSPDLSFAEIERLALVAEEAGEVIQAVGKILRHGWNSKHPSCPGFDNREQLAKEIGDFRGAVALLVQAHELTTLEYQMHAVSKLQRVQKYLHCQENISLAQICLDTHTGHGGS